ncbi:sulfoxide reductase heme-binding subunit YedZ [Sphingobium sp. DEHP117]|uniref:sulfite oxidase heme-binding subunit YedZ n=1 Tax=Sphingobium sp. DEHP117 TaxID=2993436 RepID=UPI0027D71B2C|nr:ferric reductase-like transmembrane domain-containing protein [Sphingobium sp. DEHP117]MDQ4420514.1 sulfoxide reductase heme-binding subunit YedZ [Sphingobium sp. DEHP117]
MGWLRAHRQGLAHIVMALPVLVLAVRWAMMITGGDPRAVGLSAEPIDYTINYLGLWAIRFLILSLAITPLRTWTRWSWLAPLRRPLGLWAFACALLHLSVYFLLDQLGSFTLLWESVAKHPFILLGMAAFTLLLPLALTSTRASIRRLGGRRWQALHRLVYLSAIFAAIHFILRVKGFQPEPWIYAGIAGALLLVRALPTAWVRRA